ncbi:hypothetical protein [Egicoccus sp. AB-alg6-2]|uniref:hypothetical protein n=1 Tax=Egicoccus sp. AB-alg6-2 TaxID=3242692 RepID=UPI00359DFA9B
MFELLTPAGQEMATRADLEAGFAAMDARFSAMEQRFAAMDRRMDERFAAMDQRFAAMDQRMDERLGGMVDRATFERRIGEAVTSQTHNLVLSQLAALVTIAALAFGLR